MARGLKTLLSAGFTDGSTVRNIESWTLSAIIAVHFAKALISGKLSHYIGEAVFADVTI